MGIENIKMGACSVSFDSNDLGLTLGGVTLTVETKIEDLPLLGRYANSHPRIISTTISVMCPLAEMTYDLLHRICPWSTLSQGKLSISDMAGVVVTQYAKELIITPSGYDGESVLIPSALPRPNLSHTYNYNKERVTEVSFLALPDENGTLITFR